MPKVISPVPISSVAPSSSLLRQMTLLPGKSPMSSVAYALCIIASRIRPSASSRIAPQTAPYSVSSVVFVSSTQRYFPSRHARTPSSRVQRV